MLLIYKILILLVIVFLCKGYFRVKYPFWSIQPVFHFHNVYYWMFPPGIINHSLPKRHPKFYDTSIQVKKFDSVNEYDWQNIIMLLQKHYLKRKDIAYNPTLDSVQTYLKNLDHTSLLCLKYDEKYFPTTKENHKKLIGVISGRPWVCYLSTHKQKFYVNYVDYLCVHKKHRKSGIAPKLIHTYYVNQRNQTGNPIFLFKRESAVNAFVPLTTYMCYGFSLKYLSVNKNINSKKKSTNKPLISLLNTSCDYIYNHLETLCKHFSCFILTSFSNLQSLLSSENIYIYGSIKQTYIECLYFFRNTQTKIDGFETIECFGSFRNNGFDEKYFYEGFVDALYDLKEKDYKTLIIENISHNHIILKEHIKHNTREFQSQYSYYFYNFALRPFLCNSVCLIG